MFPGDHMAFLARMLVVEGIIFNGLAGEAACFLGLVLLGLVLLFTASASCHGSLHVAQPAEHHRSPSGVWIPTPTAPRFCAHPAAHNRREAVRRSRGTSEPR
jgi:hypothetical protein